MDSKITFLRASANRRLVKKYTTSGVSAYPLIKKFSSETYVVPINPLGLDLKLDLFKRHATSGDCLLKGELKKDLHDESRANQTDNNASTQSIIFDIDGLELDGVELPKDITSDVLKGIAERVIDILPETFHDVSYVCHPSASMGMKGDKISMHLDFWLSHPIHPRALKEYITALNFQLPEFEERLELTASGTALRYKLDRSLADNSRLVFIGTPEFDKVDNPIQDDDRVFLVKKKNLTADITEALQHCNPTANQTATKRKISKIRNALGLPAKKERSKSLTINGQTLKVTVNPDRVHMDFVRESDNFVYYNINNGDSNAYYVWKDSPKIVHNFKGEPNFLFEEADPDTYQWHLKEYAAPIGKGSNAHIKPMVFRDFGSDTYYNALYNVDNNRFEQIAPASRGSLEDYMAHHGDVMPDVVPTWSYEFKPMDKRVIDIEAGFINKYAPSEMLRKPVAIDPAYTNLKYGELNRVADLCPTTFKVLFSMIGSSQESYDYFMNWLAFVLQRREKTQTAWILQGTTGTGKGVLYNQILLPLLTAAHTTEKTIQDIEEHYNAWMETALVTCIDEFRFRDSASGEKLMAKIKNMITEPRQSIRAMRANQVETQSYNNFLFMSNVHDVVSITGDDRRFHVGPRQETPLAVAYPGIRKYLIKDIQAELPSLAAILLTCEIVEEKVRVPLDNEARQHMKEASVTTVDEFCNAIRNGNMDYFSPVLDLRPSFSGEDYTSVAQNTVKAWLRDYKDGDPVRVWTSELRALYIALVGKCDTDRRLGKILAHRGLAASGIKKNNINRNGFSIEFVCSETSRGDLCKHYLTQADIDAKLTPSYLHNTLQ